MVSKWGEVKSHFAVLIIKMTGETPEIRYDERKQREEREKIPKRETLGPVYNFLYP